MPDAQQIQDYLRRSGDDAFKWQWPMHEFNGGWFNYFINEDDNQLCIGQAYGSHSKLALEARGMARHLGCTQIVFATKRNGLAFSKLTGAKIIATVLELPLEG